jgi:hypothetical protein
MRRGLGARDFEATRDFGERDKNERDKSPVDIDPVNVILGIREELAEFRRNGGKQALRATMRKACEEALLQTMRGTDPDSFERALSEPGGIIEYLRDRGVIPPVGAASRPRRRRRRRDAENG